MLVVGEALVDVVRRADGGVDESPGGSPANVALTLGRLGHTPTLLTRLGDDERGERVRAWLAQSGVGVVAADAPRTATATARLDASGSATYEFDLDWALLGAGAGLPASIIHTGSIAALLEPGATDVTRLVRSLRQSALLTFDPNVRPALLPSREEARARVEAWVAVADLVKASDEDLAWLCPDKDPLETAEAWLASGPAVVVVTLGGGGAVALTRSGRVRVAAERVDVVDTVGAGDTFMGALIDGLVQSGCEGAEARSALREISPQSLTRMLEGAARAAAVTVSRPGADPPWREELEGA
ncbi:ribokinase [Microbacterium sp. Root180]|nr:ribokinase [Microbacterium sp. Root180]